MKLACLLLVCSIVLFVNNRPGYGQGANGDDRSFLNSSSVAEGVELGRKKKFDQAREKFEQCLSLWQQAPTALLYLEVIDDYDNKRIDKKTTNEFFKCLYEDQKSKHEKALKMVGKLIKKNKSYYPLYIIKGEILTNLQSEGEAQKQFEMATTLAGDSPLPYVFRGKSRKDSNNQQKAIDDFSHAILADSMLAIAFFERGFAYCVAKKYDEAIRDFEIAMRHYPEWGKSTIVNEALHNRGARLIGEKSYRKAIKDFDRAIEIDPQHLNSYLNRGMAYRSLKQYSKALADFTFCIENDSTFTDAYYNRALVNYDRRKYKTVIADLELAAKLDKGSQKIAFKLAESYHKDGDHKQAIAQFDRVIKLEPRHYWSYYWKGFAARDLGQRKTAISAFQTFLGLAPKQYYKQILHAEAEIKKLKMGSR